MYIYIDNNIYTYIYIYTLYLYLKSHKLSMYLQYTLLSILYIYITYKEDALQLQ